MRGLHLFVTIILSLSATAYDAPRPRRRDIRTVAPGNEVDALGVPNRDLTVLSTSNISDARSLNMNRRREPEASHPENQGLPWQPVQIAVDHGRVVGAVSFDGTSVSRVVLDTSSSKTWMHSSASSSTVRGTVSVGKVSSREMEYVTVSAKTQNTYGGGIALDRSDKSWLKFMNADRVIAFAIRHNGKGGIHLGALHQARLAHIEWHNVRVNDIKWILEEKAHMKVNGKVEAGNIITVMDTGARYIYGPASDVSNLYKSLGGTYSKEQALWLVPCGKHWPVVSFSWGKKDFPIVSPEEECNTHYCGLVQSLDKLPTNTWVLGTPFGVGKYLALDDMEGKVGLALLDDDEV